MKISLMAICVFCAALSAPGAPLAVTVDGIFSDWQGVTPAHSDPIGDYGDSTIDFGRLWMAHDDDFLHLRIEVGPEMIRNSGNALTLYIDWDNSASTGYSIRGMGAEMKWVFGSRSGTAYTSDGSVYFKQSAVTLLRAPTVSSTEYEIAFSRKPDLDIPTGSQIRILIRNDTAEGDSLPNTGSLSYTFTDGAVTPPEFIPLERHPRTRFRIMSWNVLYDGLFLRPEPFRRIIKALNPDILCFQEIYSYTGAQTRDFVAGVLPLPAGQQWYYSENADCIIISRWQVTGKWNTDGNLAVLIDTPADFPVDHLFIVNTHLPAGTNNTQRQAEVDRILQLLRDGIQPGGSFTLNAGTPAILCGDMNLVTYAQHLNSLIYGDIADEATYGADFQPDWNGTPLQDLCPRHASARQVYTWESVSSTYDPGRLDFFIYTDSVMMPARSFVLRSRDLPGEVLEESGILAGDNETAADHLPIVADFQFETPVQAWTVY